jgi:hypothetical protein
MGGHVQEFAKNFSKGVGDIKGTGFMVVEMSPWNSSVSLNH